MEIGKPLPNIVFGSVDSIVKDSTTKEIKERTEKFEQYLTNTKGVEKTERTKTLEQWIQSLEELKARLDNDTTKDNLDTYKESVKRFLDYYIDNDIYIKEHRTKDGLYYSKTVQIIKAVDDKIDHLTEDLLYSQMGNLKVLKLTGEIQGMLFEIIA